MQERGNKSQFAGLMCLLCKMIIVISDKQTALYSSRLFVLLPLKSNTFSAANIIIFHENKILQAFQDRLRIACRVCPDSIPQHDHHQY